MALFRLGPSGGLGGTNPFDDFEPRDPEVRLPPDNSRVHFVRVAALAADENANPGENHPELIHGIQIEHILDGNPADSFPLEEHGLPMQGRNPHQVLINRGEYIKRIEGTSASARDRPQLQRQPPGEACVGMRKPAQFSVLPPSPAGFERLSPADTAIAVAQAGQKRDPASKPPGNLANVG
jgi:hypothetical protein